MPTYRLAFGVVKYFPYGGMQRNLVRIAAACRAAGHEVHVFTSAWEGPRPEGLHVTILPVGAMTNHGLNARFGAALRAAASDGGFDCLVGFNRLPGLDVYYAGDPCFAAVAATTKSRVARLLPRSRTYLEQERAVFAPGVGTELLLTAHAERDRFIAHHGTEPERFHLLPPGVDRARLEATRVTPADRHALRAGLGADDDDLLVLSVGSGFRTKGVQRTIRAIAALPPTLRARARLAVVGAGRPGGLAWLARRLGVHDRVVFTGPREDVPRLYRAADLLAHPALNENTGNVLIEAMLCGLPVLTTATCGFAIHVEAAGAGLVCPTPFVQHDLDAALRTMLASGDRAAWGEGGLRYCERTDVSSMIERAAAVIIARAARHRAGTPLVPA